MWSKIKNIFTSLNKKKLSLDNDKPLDLNDGKLESEESIFIKKFNSCGGKFIFCDNQNEITSSLNNIILENNLKSIICLNNQLQQLLTSTNINFSTTINCENKEVDFMFLNCENLIAFDGSIMVSSDQIKSFKLNHLPKNLIVLSKFNQITTNLSSALRRIKSEKDNNLPTNITTIKAIKTDGFEDISILKNIYLLMVD